MLSHGGLGLALRTIAWWVLQQYVGTAIGEKTSTRRRLLFNSISIQDNFFEVLKLKEDLATMGLNLANAVSPPC